MRLIFTLFICSLFFYACTQEGSSQKTATQATENQNIGGKCTYKELKGEIEIMMIKEAESFMNNCPNPKRVAFTFRSGSEKTNGFLTINAGKNPSDAWLKRHAVEVGKKFEAIKKDIVEGTCTPIVWEFPKLDIMPEKACE